MMKVISILNLKGGVAKTCTTVNVAAILAMDYGKNVLVVDADSQCNTTEFFCNGDVDIGTLADILRSKPDEGMLAVACIEYTRYERIQLLRADSTLMDLDLSKVEGDKVYTKCLVDLVKVIGDDYDYVLIDCPPAFNAASAAALLASDEVIIPIKLDAFSLRGMANVMRQIANMRKINPGLKLAGILPTMWYRSSKITEAEELLRKSGLPVFDHIRRTNKVDDMTFAQVPLIEMSRNSAAAVDYRRFVKALIGGERNV